MLWLHIEKTRKDELGVKHKSAISLHIASQSDGKNYSLSIKYIRDYQEEKIKE